MIRYQINPTERVFVCRAQLCSAILAEQWDVSDSWDIIHHRTSDTPPPLSKQVHCHDPRSKRLVASNWPSITCDLHKTLQVYVRGWITHKWDAAYCYGSASEKLQGSYVRSERWRVAPGLPLNCSILHQMLLPPSFCITVLCSFILP